jgi:hypothetical protein
MPGGRRRAVGVLWETCNLAAGLCALEGSQRRGRASSREAGDGGPHVDGRQRGRA